MLGYVDAALIYLDGGGADLIADAFDDGAQRRGTWRRSAPRITSMVLIPVTFISGCSPSSLRRAMRISAQTQVNISESRQRSFPDLFEQTSRWNHAKIRYRCARIVLHSASAVDLCGSSDPRSRLGHIRRATLCAEDRCQRSDFAKSPMGAARCAVPQELSAATDRRRRRCANFGTGRTGERHASHGATSAARSLPSLDFHG
jgi:hypothetical protein